MGGSKPAASVAASASETNTVRSPWGKMAKGIKNVAEDVKSKINLFNKKPATATEPVAAKAPTKQPFDVRATESKSSLSSAPPATPAAAPAPVAVAPVAVAPPAPVVEAPAAVIAAPPAPPAVEAAQSTSHALPPKSAIKEILKNYHEAVASPISTKPAPVISVASVTSPAAPLASLPMTAASVPAPVASAPIAAPVAPVVPPPAVATLQPAEPHVLREHVAAPAQPVAAAAPAQTAVVAAQEAEEEDDYDPANNYQIEDTYVRPRSLSVSCCRLTRCPVQARLRRLRRRLRHRRRGRVQQEEAADPRVGPRRRSARGPGAPIRPQRPPARRPRPHLPRGAVVLARGDLRPQGGSVAQVLGAHQFRALGRRRVDARREAAVPGTHGLRAEPRRQCRRSACEAALSRR